MKEIILRTNFGFYYITHTKKWGYRWSVCKQTSDDKWEWGYGIPGLPNDVLTARESNRLELLLVTNQPVPDMEKLVLENNGMQPLYQDVQFKKVEDNEAEPPDQDIPVEE